MTPSSSLTLRRYGAAHGSHAHDHFQVLVGLQGVLELEVQGRSLRLGAGEGWVVLPGQRHDFEAQHGSQCLVLDSPAPAWSACPVQPARPAQAAALARYLACALQAQDTQAALYGPWLLLDAWCATPAARPARRTIHWPTLLAWAQQRWQHDVTLDDLAAQVFLSPSQFAARCVQETGLSPMQWLRSQRLAHARQLRAGGMRVAEVAQRTGYRSPSALTAALRRETPLP